MHNCCCNVISSNPARLAVLLAGCLLLAGCTSLFMLPMRQQILDPAQRGLVHEEFRIASADGTSLYGWHLKAAAPHALVCFFHGNAENISTHLMSVEWLPAENIDVVLVDYRGYGASAGEASFPDVLDDVAAALDECLRRAGGLPVLALGQSLGGALLADVAARDAYRRRLSGVILDSSFTRYRTIAREAMTRSWLLWAFQYPLSGLVTGAHAPEDAVAQLAGTPLLVMHSRDDGIIGLHHGERLYARAAPPRCWLETTGPHIAAFRAETYRADILAFMEAVVSGRVPPAGGALRCDWPAAAGPR
jgi:fermentation-respiration switch protein FrsA (DUF1100 family)